MVVMKAKLANIEADNNVFDRSQNQVVQHLESQNKELRESNEEYENRLQQAQEIYQHLASIHQTEEYRQLIENSNATREKLKDIISNKDRKIEVQLIL